MEPESYCHTKAMAAGKAMRRGTVKQGGSSVQAGRAGTACRAPTAIRAVCIDLSEESIGAEDQAQRQSGDCDFSESAYDERAKTLLTHVAYIGAQADACEREQKGPARKIREAGELVFAENVGSTTRTKAALATLATGAMSRAKSSPA